MSLEVDGFLQTFARQKNKMLPICSKDGRYRNNMFERLQQKWKVSGLQVILILCTFAIGGSLTGYAGKKLMNLLDIEQRWLWILVYIIIVTILWPVAVLLVSVFFGQFRFFTGYLKKMGRRMGIVNPESSKREPEKTA